MFWVLLDHTELYYYTIIMLLTSRACERFGCYWILYLWWFTLRTYQCFFYRNGQSINSVSLSLDPPLCYALVSIKVQTFVNTNGYGFFQYPLNLNAINEPASIQTLDLRVRNSFNLKVVNEIFANNCAKIPACCYILLHIW